MVETRGLVQAKARRRAVQKLFAEEVRPVRSQSALGSHGMPSLQSMACKAVKCVRSTSVCCFLSVCFLTTIYIRYITYTVY